MKKIVTTCIMIHFLILTTLAQNLDQKVSLNFKNTPLQEILDHISKTYAIQFFFGNDRIPIQQKLSIEVIEKPLNVAMEILLADLNIQYKLIENYVVLRKDNTV